MQTMAKELSPLIVLLALVAVPSVRWLRLHHWYVTAANLPGTRLVDIASVKKRLKQLFKTGDLQIKPREACRVTIKGLRFVIIWAKATSIYTSTKSGGTYNAWSTVALLSEGKQATAYAKTLGKILRCQASNEHTGVFWIRSRRKLMKLLRAEPGDIPVKAPGAADEPDDEGLPLEVSALMPSRTRRPAPLLVPRYDELSLFLMSFAFVLIFFTSVQLRSIAYTAIVTHFDWKYYPFYGLLLLFAGGLVFSIRHVFSTEKKTDWQKTAMIYFAVIVNALAGFMAGIYMADNAHGILMVFPLWNILNALILLLMYWVTLIDESTMPDDDATPKEAGIGALAVFVLFLLCRFFDVYWALTFSICVSYATNFSEITRRFLRWKERTAT